MTDGDRGDGPGRGDPLLEVEDLRKYFTENDTLVDTLLRNEERSVKAVDGVSFTVEKGETLGLVGESGCGKSTTGETLLGLQEPTDGDVRFDGESVFEMEDAALDEFRRRAQIVFQDPFSSLDPRQTAGAIIAEPLVIHGRPATDPGVRTEADLQVEGIDRSRVTVTVEDDVDRVVEPTEGVATVHLTVRQEGGAVRATVEENLETRMQVDDDGSVSVRVRVGRSVSDLRRERAKELLERVGLSADQVDRYPHEFSGGQRQRIGIARALALEPEFLVLDEPVSALDVSVQAQVLNLLDDLQEEFGLTYLFIAHDLSVVRHISDRVAVMYLGEIVERGPVESIFEDPQHPYTEALLESVPRADTSEQGRRVDALAGDVPSPRDPPSGCRFHTRCPHAREACREEAPDDYDAGVEGQQAACFRALEDHPYWESDPIEVTAGADDDGSGAAADDD
ncbi:ABC transporter ATP-binding protein [Halorarius halobius]|uniref:ABC transporter ATP-binding protein n=1 Tax=Halorarius halobius TaxID=2962671 RepID=UPI003313E209